MAYAGHKGRLDTSIEVKNAGRGREIEYVMSKTHYNGLEKKDATAQYVNEVYGLLGKVIKVHVEK